MRALVIAVFAAASAVAAAAEPLTAAESSGYSRTSLYVEVIDFVRAVAAESPRVALSTLTRSLEGRDVPLVILSREGVRTPAELRSAGKPAVLVMANIHAGEVEGKEACQMLIREVGTGRLAGLLDHQVVLLLPIFNADGNERLGPNRRDHGPELAGVRHNSQYLDLNRDFIKLESPEVRALVRLLRTWDPVLMVDMHTTNGSYHRDPVTYATGSHPNTAEELTSFMWRHFFPSVGKRLREGFGWGNLPYGTYIDAENPHQGWRNDAIEARYSTNYVALRNRLTILNENYSHADFKTRVLASFDFLRSILEYTNTNAREIAARVNRIDASTRAEFMNTHFVVDWRLEPFMEITVRGFEHERVPTTAEQRAQFPWLGEYRMAPTSTPRDYTVPYMARAVATRSTPLPRGYVLLPGFSEAIDNLHAHGIVMERLVRPATLVTEHYRLTGVRVAERLFQGHAMVSLSGGWEEAETPIPAGAVFIDLRQPLARLVPILLEPDSTDSLATWGFFNRALVRQWSSEPGLYPIVRVHRRPPVPLLVLAEPGW